MPPLAKDARLAIKQSLESLLEILHMFGMTKTPDLSRALTHWVHLAEESGGSWMKVAKYKLAAFYSFHHDQPLPPRPWEQALDSPSHLLGGAADRFISLYLKTHSPNEKEELLQSILQGKKGMPRPNAAELAAATEKFVEKMTTVVDDNQGRTVQLIPNWADQSDYPDTWNLSLNAEAVRTQLRRTVEEIFGDTVYSYTDRLRPFFPSTSATYNNHRSDAGSVGAILTEPGLLDGLRKSGGHLEVRVTTKEKEQEEEHIENEDQEEKTVEADMEPLESNFQTLWHRLIAKAAKEDSEVRAVALPEALKVRMITAMPAFQQAVLRSLRSKLHGVMKHHPVFHLIGAPVTESYILDRMGLNLKEGHAYLSGDYDAATDNIFRWVSEAVVDAIGDILKLAHIERELFIRALTGSRFRGKLQQIGQLMGSILSFIVLCIINAAMTRWAIELAERRLYSLRDAPLAVNGDDVAAKGHASRLHHFWSQITSFVGLRQSIGKTFVSKEFVNINSTSYMRQPEAFVINYERRDGTTVERKTFLKLTKFVNLGLLKGLKRSGGTIGLNDLSDTTCNLGTRARELLRLAPTHLHEQVMKIFIKHHRNVLRETGLPWYMPEWIGGLGLPRGSWGNNSELDLRLAKKIILNWRTRHPIPLTHRNAPWKTWLRATKALPTPFYSREKNEATEEYNAIVGRKCIDLLFDADISLQDLFTEVNSSTARRAITHNARLWAHSATSGSFRLPTPVDEQALEFQPLYPNFLKDDPRLTLRDRSLAIAKDKGGEPQETLD
jgi:hypothetical protein